MEDNISFAQLLKQAIDNRLLDVHTALIGRIEKYDPNTQLADIQPVLKRALTTKDGTVKQEELPLLVDVPIIFPRAGEFFISLPIAVGDYVQVIFNETSIDAFFTESPSNIASDRRFILQGAIAIAGIASQSKPLQSAHTTNLVAGRDGGVQIHIDHNKIRLGSEKADEALAIASRVEEELKKIHIAFSSHVHTYHNTVTLTQLAPIGDITTKKVVAE